jgi:hypothetical protein
MIHRTYRRLDEPPKLAGFSFAQWLALLMLGGAVYGMCRLLTLPTQPAISLFTVLVGGPAALIYFSESGRPSLLRLVRDFIRGPCPAAADQREVRGHAPVRREQHEVTE